MIQVSFTPKIFILFYLKSDLSSLLLTLFVVYKTIYQTASFSYAFMTYEYTFDAVVCHLMMINTRIHNIYNLLGKGSKVCDSLMKCENYKVRKSTNKTSNYFPLLLNNFISLVQRNIYFSNTL